jgi:hypothetical protein
VGASAGGPTLRAHAAWLKLLAGACAKLCLAAWILPAAAVPARCARCCHSFASTSATGGGSARAATASVTQVGG